MIDYQITFNPNGGDLGRSSLSPVTPLEFQVIVPHVAHILEALHLSSNKSSLPFRYAFEFFIRDRKLIADIITCIKLPPHVSFYETDGQKLFEMRGASGGVISGLICYLITQD